MCSVSWRRLIEDLLDLSFATPMYRMWYSVYLVRTYFVAQRKWWSQQTWTFFLNYTTGHSRSKHGSMRRVFVPCNINVHVFLDCGDTVFYWDVLQRTLKKYIPLTAHGIRFLRVENSDPVPYDAIMVIGLKCIWLSPMAVRHADINPWPVSYFLFQRIRKISKIYRTFEESPYSLPVLDAPVILKCVWSLRHSRLGWCVRICFGTHSKISLCTSDECLRIGEMYVRVMSTW